MTVDQARVLWFLDFYERTAAFQKDELKFHHGICQVLLGHYCRAQQLFETSCIAMARTQFWKAVSSPNWLVEICILAGNASLYGQVAAGLDLYKNDDRGDSPIAQYAYGLMELLAPSGGNVDSWVHGVVAKPKFKNTYAMGKVLQAIILEDQGDFNSALAHLLKIHAGMARRGALRETVEGLLCMPAVSLAYVARRRGLRTEMESDFLSQGYLEHLLAITATTPTTD